jgi:hypothetical protein
MMHVQGRGPTISPPRYTLIKGKFWIHYPNRPKTGPEPDGDTVSFQPDNRNLVLNLKRYGTRWPNFNGEGVIPIRFEAIDALETHFSGAHQELDLARLARNEVLHWLGFRDVVFWDDAPNKVKSVANNPLPGYLLANGIEGNGRVLAFVYRDEAQEEDGTRVRVDSARFNASLNGMLLEKGLAYAELYTSLPIDLVAHARQVARTARAKPTGLYKKEDVGTAKSAVASTLGEVQKLVLWPKLFRRLVTYFREGNLGLDDFDAWMRIDPKDRDDRLLLPNGELGNMHDLYIVELDPNRLQMRDAIRMVHNPEELVILPDEASPLYTP